ncbi:uncharacterized protein LOC110023508 [Phalaenopsis equestris]|uniref:uncharacterized protein LOC110023508 n=1 Tax=Phalaenopsis equestris TaxID=78828 RepID=UPI0009E2E539|nr:uncharacterized protein LOC110023508 [Phalaenopsis equestris]
MREEMYGYAKLLRFFLRILSCFLCIGLIVSMVGEGGGGGGGFAPAPTLAPAMLKEREMSNGRNAMAKLVYVSKRRVPNGPDPIHNRRAGDSGRSPRGA